MNDERTRECPSCAMEVPEDAETCPYCGYEFPAPASKISVWVALLMAALLAWPAIKLIQAIF
jgi:predicted amidophosphoribosyltransferase